MTGTELGPGGGGRPRTLRQLAASIGVDPVEVERADAEGTLGLFIVDHLVVPEPGVYTQDEIIARSGLGEDARKFWRALGFPDPDPGERVFSQVDLDMLQLVASLVRDELIDPAVALQMARVIGSSMQRVAQSQIDAIGARIDAEHGSFVDAVDGDGQLDAEPDEQLAVGRLANLMPTMPRVLEYTWRRAVRSAARRRMVGDHLAAASEQARGVGFADLVGFTALSQQLGDAELAGVVDRFESAAYDLVSSRGGRVVKMIGDEVMFEVLDPGAAVEIGLDLADMFHADDAVSDLRVGIAYGPALAREGDLYGPTVNLAARIVTIAYAGSVVASGEVRDALAGDERFAWRTLRSRHLKHLGRVRLHVVRRAGDAAESMAERARRRGGTLRDRVTELVDRTVPVVAAGDEEE